MQQCARRRLLRVFVRRGLLAGDDARAMAHWEHADVQLSFDYAIARTSSPEGTVRESVGNVRKSMK